MADVAQGTGKEGTAGKQNHRQANDPGGPAQQTLHLCAQIPRVRNVGGPRVHHDLHHAKTRHQPAPQGTPLFLHALLARLGIGRRERAIARAAHRSKPEGRGRSRCIPDHPGTLAGSTDICLLNAGDAAQCIFNRQCTGCAVHAFNDHVRLPALTRSLVVQLAAKDRPLRRIVQQAVAAWAGHCGRFRRRCCGPARRKRWNIC